MSIVLLTTLFFFVPFSYTNSQANTIFKCKNKKGTYIYQEMPCLEESTKDSSWSSKARQNTFHMLQKTLL